MCSWQLDVQFVNNGMLKATASGVALLPPAAVAALVTDAAGDSLFRVAARSPLAGSQRVQVSTRAAIRVLAWKLCTVSNVAYDIQQLSDGTGGCKVAFGLISSNILNHLSGSWHMQPVQVHVSTLQQQQQPRGLWKPDADGHVAATLVTFEQLAAPKGLPPGVRFVPGLSAAVRGSVRREVAQLLHKLGQVASLAAEAGVTPQAALQAMALQVAAAGGSWKRFLKSGGASGQRQQQQQQQQAPGTGCDKGPSSHKLQLLQEAQSSDAPASPQILAGQVA